MQNDNFSKCAIWGQVILFHQKIMFRFQDFQVFVFLTIPWFTKFVTSWWVLVHETGCIFLWIYLLNHNSLYHETWSTYKYKEGKEFSGIFCVIWKTGAKFQVLFNLVTSSNYTITSRQNSSVSLFWKGE